MWCFICIKAASSSHTLANLGQNAWGGYQATCNRMIICITIRAIFGE